MGARRRADSEIPAGGAQYDLYSTSYSPDGRVFQVEYAGKAVESSGCLSLALTRPPRLSRPGSCQPGIFAAGGLGASKQEPSSGTSCDGVPHSVCH